MKTSQEGYRPKILSMQEGATASQLSSGEDYCPKALPLVELVVPVAARVLLACDALIAGRQE